jgi:CheY-like chemotaxis protein/HPt (histidine-containing phosphotransfer) domain-containing protein
MPLDPAATALHGSVLLVEDNPINQGVARAMLTKLGLSMTLANHGQEALDIVRERDFDLVLMDCQMPVMDGFAATEAIRRLPGGCGRSVPIVALTANTMQGDEARCLRSGMDDFLAKPYSMDQLRATLQRWLPALGSVSAGAAVAVDTAVGELRTTSGSMALDAAPQTINRATLEALREIDPSGSTDLMKEVLGMFLGTTAKTVAQLRDAVAAGHSPAIGRAAHSLKSSAANVGAESLAIGYRELEKCGREERVDDARALIDSVMAEHGRAAAALREILEDLEVLI